MPEAGGRQARRGLCPSGKCLVLAGTEQWTVFGLSSASPARRLRGRAANTNSLEAGSKGDGSGPFAELGSHDSSADRWTWESLPPGQEGVHVKGNAGAPVGEGWAGGGSSRRQGSEPKMGAMAWAELLDKPVGCAWKLGYSDPWTLVKYSPDLDPRLCLDPASV